ncbi:MAG: epoxyqueuosine reductase QueH [Ruminococcaceae bacterium]|nr:epoxyqueuosine reductase QueH [Oscillospiraceae bacterium]
MKRNYQQMMEEVIRRESSNGRRPTLLLHACCAPCSSYVLEALSPYFSITLFYYNPNISPRSEYEFRLAELARLIREMGLDETVTLIDGGYEPDRFLAIASGREQLPEGGSRCADCYRLRLRKTAEVAAEGGFAYFTTTLSISPYKNAEWLNTIGEEEGRTAGVPYLPSDFKKRNGYKRSCELSELYQLYRQNYCGCVYSKRASD